MKISAHQVKSFSVNKDHFINRVLLVCLMHTTHIYLVYLGSVTNRGAVAIEPSEP